MSARSSSLHPRAVPELDQRHERRRAARGRARAPPSPRRDFVNRGWYWSSTPRSFPDSSSGSSAPRNSRNAASVGSPSCHVIAADALTWNVNAVGRPLGPALRHGGVGQRVERRVDLDDVEPLGVVAQALLRGRDAARIPGFEQPLVGPASTSRCARSPPRHVSIARAGALAAPALVLRCVYRLADLDVARRRGEAAHGRRSRTGRRARPNWPQTAGERRAGHDRARLEHVVLDLFGTAYVNVAARLRPDDASLRPLRRPRGSSPWSRRLRARLRDAAREPLDALHLAAGQRDPARRDGAPARRPCRRR